MNRFNAHELAGFRGGAPPSSSYREILTEAISERAIAARVFEPLRYGQLTCTIAEAYRRGGHIDCATHEYLEACNIFEASRDLNNLAWAQWGLGSLYRQIGIYPNSMRYLGMSERSARSAKNGEALLYSVAGQAECQRQMGNYSIALVQHFKLLSRFRRLNDPRGVSWALEGVAQIYLCTDRIMEALDLFRHAKGIAEACGDRRGLAWALRGLAECLLRTKQFDDAAHFSILAGDLFESIGMPVGLAFALKTQSDIGIRTYRLDNALDTAISAIKEFSKSGHTTGKAYAQTSFARILFLTGQTSAAKLLATEAFDVFRKANVKLGMAMCRDLQKPSNFP